MPRRGWDDPWQSYPASVPLPAEGGLATSKLRGPMTSTWWSRRFTEVLESYGLGARIQRGRRYARTGQVLGLDVRTAIIAAQVQGSRRTPYLVTVSLPEPTEQQWRSIDGAIAAKVGFVARLLAGEVPPDLDDVFRAAGVTLFPDSWADLRSECSCPDWENPCKHIAAVLYVFADQLDADPWLVLAWRGRTRDQILNRLRAPAGTPTAEEIAPWWPFAPGPLPPLPGDRRRLDASTTPAPDPADAVLDAVEPLHVQVGTRDFIEALRPVYVQIVGDDLPDNPET